jgi:hypothetical protein
MLRPGALLENCLMFHTKAVRLIKQYIIIFNWERLYSLVRFPALQVVPANYYLPTQTQTVHRYYLFLQMGFDQILTSGFT